MTLKVEVTDDTQVIPAKAVSHRNKKHKKTRHLPGFLFTSKKLMHSF